MQHEAAEIMTHLTAGPWHVADLSILNIQMKRELETQQTWKKSKS